MVLNYILVGCPSLHVRETKTVLDSGFLVVDFGSRVLDSGFYKMRAIQSLVGFRIPCAVFRNLKLKIPDSRGKNSWISDVRCRFFLNLSQLSAFVEQRENSKASLPHRSAWTGNPQKLAEVTIPSPAAQTAKCFVFKLRAKYSKLEQPSKILIA